MKKIGILFGQERSFPQAFVDRINAKNIDGITAEFVSIDKVMQAEPTAYSVIVDRISQDVPFYRAYLKNAAACGTAVINNPFWWSADEKFFNNVLAEKVGVPVPKTVLLPSRDNPDDTNQDSFLNLAYPLDWEGIFDYVGFPAFMKPFAGGGWKNVYKLEDRDMFFEKYAETGQLVMMLQEAIDFTAYFRCYCIGRKYVKIMHYEPRNPHHLRYAAHHEVSEELLQTVHDYTIRLNEVLGYDFNTVEFAIKDGIPYAIDFCNPAPDAALESVGQENFDWVVETAATYAIERAQAAEPGQDNLSWGTFLQDGIRHSLSGTASPSTANGTATPAEVAIDTTSNEEVALTTLLGEAKEADKENLKKIEGIGPKMEKILNKHGIFTVAQLAKLTAENAEAVKGILSKEFKGKIAIDKWMEQVKA